MSRRLNAPTEERSSLAQDVEFLRFLTERLADAKRDSDRCQNDIDTWMEQIESKRREQSEHMRIIDACQAGIGINDRSLRPAPQILEHEMEKANDPTVA